MESLTHFVSTINVVAALLVYLASLAFYRLFLHPLAHFPGPRLAAVSRYYEGYFDVVKNGQYTFKIADLHKTYGPIVRISPHELHVSDPAFFNTLYCTDAHYDKYSWTYEAFGVNGSSLTTAGHDLHRSRRQPLAPFFSQARVASQQKIIRKHLSKLLCRFSKLADIGVVFNFGASMTALTRDVANDFILNKTYNSLDRDDFDVIQLTIAQGSGGIWRLSQFVRFVAPTLHALPIPWLIKTTDPDTVAFFRHILDTQKDTKQLIERAISDVTDRANRRTIVDEIIDDPKLPQSEKSFKRVFDDVTTTTAAGFETTASALRLVFFHVFSDQSILRRIRNELSLARIRDGPSLDWKGLEKIPFLSAILHEGLRLSPGVSTRMARICPKADLQYEQWRVPAGTPVGMTVVLMHFDPEIWPQPKLFKPERWLNADGTFKYIDRGFAPFSRGTRACLGQYLAWAEMYIVFAEIVERFDFDFLDASAADFEPSSDQFSVGTNSKGNLRAIAARYRA